MLKGDVESTASCFLVLKAEDRMFVFNWSVEGEVFLPLQVRRFVGSGTDGQKMPPHCQESNKCRRRTSDGLWLLQIIRFVST